MKLINNPVLVDHSGEPFAGPKGPLTLRGALALACSSVMQGDDSLDLVRKFEIGKTGSMLQRGEEVTSDQLLMAKERAGKYFSPGLMFSIYSVIEAQQE